MINRSFLIKSIFVKVRNAKNSYADFFACIIFTFESIPAIYTDYRRKASNTPTIWDVKRDFIGNIFDFRADLLIMAIIGNPKTWKITLFLL